MQKNAPPDSIKVVISETRLLGVDLDQDGKAVHVVVELWVLKENIFDRYFDVYDKPTETSISIARMLTLEFLDKIGLRPMVKNEGRAQFVMALRRRILRYASEDDLNNLVAHETAHFILKHTGRDHKTEEAEVKKELGEVEVANELFLERLNLLGAFKGRKGRL